MYDDNLNFPAALMHNHVKDQILSWLLSFAFIFFFFNLIPPIFSTGREMSQCQLQTSWTSALCPPQAALPWCPAVHLTFL